jgi:hypothetical protein
MQLSNGLLFFLIYKNSSLLLMIKNFIKVSMNITSLLSYCREMKYSILMPLLEYAFGQKDRKKLMITFA